MSWSHWNFDEPKLGGRKPGFVADEFGRQQPEELAGFWREGSPLPPVSAAFIFCVRMLMEPHREDARLPEKVVEEMLVSMMMVPLRFTDWRATPDPLVTATDALEKGGGFVISKSLTGRGEAELRRLLAEDAGRGEDGL